MSESKAALLSRPSLQSLWDSESHSATRYSFRHVTANNPDMPTSERWWLNSDDVVEKAPVEITGRDEQYQATDVADLPDDGVFDNLDDFGDLDNEAKDGEVNSADVLDSLDLAVEANADPDAARQKAYDAGYQDGLAVAHQEQKEAELEQARQSGHMAGMKAGRAEGLEQGLKEGRDALSDQQRILNTILEQAEPWAKSIHPEQVAMMVRLIEGIARQVVLIEQLHASGAITRAVKAGLGQMAETAGTVKIELHPDDVAEIKVLSEKEQEDWDLVADTSLTIGGCRISSDDVIVDSTVERRLTSALEAVKASFMLDMVTGGNPPIEVKPAPEIDLSPLSSPSLRTPSLHVPERTFERASERTPEPASEAFSSSPSVTSSAPQAPTSGSPAVMEKIPADIPAESTSFASSAASAGDLGAWGSLGQ